MDFERIVDRLSYEWSDNNGFLQETRRGIYNEQSAERFLQVLRDIDTEDDERLRPEIVSRLWMIPFFLLTRVHSAESVGYEVGHLRRVMWQVNDLLAMVFSGGSPRDGAPMA